MAQTGAKGDTAGMAKRHARHLAAAAATAVPLVLLLAAPAQAALPPQGAGSGITTVGLASDAWYSTSPACTATPTGCLPAGAPSTYPAKTLHVGVGAGQEESRSYLSLDLARLPAATAVTGGTLRLPVSGSDDGSRAPDTATLQACLVTASFKDDVEGAPGAPPAVDCKKATATAKHVPAAGSAPELFTINLAPFAAAWSAGAANHGLALLPAADSAPTSAWHVALSAHDRTVSAAMRVTATVSFATAVSDDFTFDNSTFDEQQAPPAGDGFGSSSASFAAPPLAPVSDPQLPSAALAAAVPAVAPQAAPVAAAPQLQPQAFALRSGYSYPGVFLLPLLLAVAGGWLARALTRDLTPA